MAFTPRAYESLMPQHVAAYRRVVTVLPGAVELAPGFWRWTAFHPAWRQEVACVALDDGATLVLVDPLAPAERRAAQRFWESLDALARERERIAVVITVHFHERHAGAIVARYREAPGALLWAPAGSESRLDATPDVTFRPGASLPGGLLAVETGRAGEVVLWAPTARAVIAGDVLLGGKRRPLRVCPQSWLPRHVTRSDVATALERLADLPVELVVPLHGEPVLEDGQSILAAAIADAKAPPA